MIMKERLLSEMAAFSVDSKWEEVLSETINEMLEIRPLNPYLYLQKKVSLKQKLQTTKTSQYLLELSLYLTSIDPLITSDQAIRDKIISLCVEKYQHIKIKKSQILQLMAVVLFPFQESKKSHFVKLIEQILDHEIFTILEYAQILLYATVFRAVLEEMTQLQLKLKQVRVLLDRNLLAQYVNTVNEKNSILKSCNVELQTEEDVYKLVAAEIVGRINI